MDLFLRTNVAAYEATDSFQKRLDVLATRVDDLHKGAPSLKSQQLIKIWQERDYGVINAEARKISDNVLQVNSKLLWGTTRR